MDDEEEKGPGIAVGAGSGGMPKATKRKGQLRKKRTDSDDEAKDGGAPTPASAPAQSAGVKKEKKVVDKKKSALSFDSEEAGDGDDAFVSKKRTAGLSCPCPRDAARSPRPPCACLTRRPAGQARRKEACVPSRVGRAFWSCVGRPMLRVDSPARACDPSGAETGALEFAKKDERSKGPAMGSYYNSGTSYSAEDLKELSKNARSFAGAPGTKPANAPGAGAPGSDAPAKRRKQDEQDVTVKMKGLPLAPRAVKAEEPEEEAAVPSLVRGHRSNKSAAEDIKSMLQSATGDDGGLMVPSDDQIARLKARREQARKMGAGTGGSMEKGFIPLEGSMEEQVCACVRVCMRVHMHTHIYFYIYTGKQQVAARAREHRGRRGYDGDGGHRRRRIARHVWQGRERPRSQDRCDGCGRGCCG